MRNNTNWEKLFPKYIKDKFPPRIQEDLFRFPIPTNLKELEKKSVFIYGGVEAGKTILASQMMLNEMKRLYINEIAGCHSTTIFVSFPEMLYEIKKSFDVNKKDESMMDKYLNAHCLVLDDFLSARPTDWVLELLYHLINHRYEYKKQTIITCNFSLEQLETLLQDQRIVSRIARSYVLIEKQNWK